MIYLLFKVATLSHSLLLLSLRPSFPPSPLRRLRCIHVSALLHARQLEENLRLYLPHNGGDELSDPSSGL